MATSDGVQVDVSLPDDQAVRTYLSRIGFYRALMQQGITVDEELLYLDPNYEVRACLPVTQIRTELEMEVAANSLHDALRSSGAPPILLTITYDVLAELTNNAREHGSPCYVLGQTHSGISSDTPGIHLAIADFGPGFRTTLQAYSPRTETDAIIKAFDDRVSGTGDPFRGMGLGWVRTHIDGYPGATLQIVSRNGMVTLAAGRFRRNRSRDCAGVLVSTYFPFSQT